MEALIEFGCIKPLSSLLVLVRKSVCVDYRVVNKNTILDRCPIPRIDELMNTAGKKKTKNFSSLDLMDRYHEVQMKEYSKAN